MSAENPLAVIAGKNRCLISRRNSVVRPMLRHPLGTTIAMQMMIAFAEMRAMQDHEAVHTDVADGNGWV
jgi:hypothetical protein